jgi:hypothetical protein
MFGKLVLRDGEVGKALTLNMSPTFILAHFLSFLGHMVGHTSFT